MNQQDVHALQRGKRRELLDVLAEQPAGTTGLARRLDPSKNYIACRWDYHQTPRAFLQGATVRVTANGKSIDCRPVDYGPGVSTNRIDPDLAAMIARYSINWD